MVRSIIIIIQYFTHTKVQLLCCYTLNKAVLLNIDRKIDRNDIIIVCRRGSLGDFSIKKPSFYFPDIPESVPKIIYGFWIFTNNFKVFVN